MSDEPEYDSKTCVMAVELREAGLSIPDAIPDVAWIHRASMSIDIGDVRESGPDRFEVGMAISFLEPFRWIRLEVEVDVVPGEKP